MVEADGFPLCVQSSQMFPGSSELGSEKENWPATATVPNPPGSLCSLPTALAIVGQECGEWVQKCKCRGFWGLYPLDSGDSSSSRQGQGEWGGGGYMPLSTGEGTVWGGELLTCFRHLKFLAVAPTVRLAHPGLWQGQGCSSALCTPVYKILDLLMHE